MAHTSANLESPQADLFDQVPPLTLSQMQMAELSKLVEALLHEIAATLATGEAGHDQDHG